MSLDFPPKFGSCSTGQRISLVGKLRCWDSTHDGHLFSSLHEDINFLAMGLLNGSGDRYSLVNVVFRQQFPIPVVAIDKDSHVLMHETPSWDSLHDVIELCSGFGGMAQGMMTSGFRPVVAVDCNEKFLQLYGVHGDVPRVHGDVNQISTMLKVWDVSKHAGTMAAGFACQPFSNLGDQLGGLDERAMCLRGILVSALLLQVQAVILECVQPAALNSFVQSEIAKFLDASGFLCTQCDLHLQDVWPCRRSRAWWLITSPMLGNIQVTSWPKLHLVPTIRHLIPALQPWDANDESELALDERELEAFGVHSDSHHKYVLNFASVAPCALHSWGSQVVACRCGCRRSGLSERRLRDKGLFGCLVCSCATAFLDSRIRRLHPNEVNMLCGLDPVLDFGTEPRLTLAASGQMASPLQACWIFAALDLKIQQLQGLDVTFGAEARLQAFMSWLLMRGRQVWPCFEEPVRDVKTQSLMNFWAEVSNFSLIELMHPPRWPMIPIQDMNLARF